MTRRITGLDPKEAEFLTTFAAQDKAIFTTERARAFWGEATYTNRVLRQLARGGWLSRLERGTYMIVPLEAGPGRDWSESALVIAPYLIQPAAIAYWSALHYWHLTEQTPRTVFVQSTARKRVREKVVSGIAFRFITVVETKFFGTIRRTLSGRPFVVTDREKTLVDAADRPEISGGAHQLAQALQAAAIDVDWERLDGYLQRWPTTAPLKRIGYLLEALDVDIPERDARLTRWQHALAPGIVLLEPETSDREGPIVTRWGLQINVTGPWSPGRHA